MPLAFEVGTNTAGDRQITRRMGMPQWFEWRVKGNAHEMEPI
jgi:hypothetical protein